MATPPKKTIIVPIATNCTNQAVLTLPWFVDETDQYYDPDQATFLPLVNGAETFGAVYDAILHARSTVDIICWGFQPSMYFKRGAEASNSTLMIGELLNEIGALGVHVRLLCWLDITHLTDTFNENNQPGNNAKSQLFSDTRNSAQREYDSLWYARAARSNVTLGRSLVDKMETIAGSFMSDTPPPAPFDNLEFATRDFDILDRTEIAWRSAMQGADDERSTASRILSSASLAVVPTHHQKMVLIDIESAQLAKGFVMGHNMLDEYWDTSAHSCLRLHPQMGRNGQHPRQDISTYVTGPILKSLNANFCEAWDKATGQSLGKTRVVNIPPVSSIKASDRAAGTPVMAQVLRTQSQSGENGVRDIEALYLQAANNVTNFIYIENQYFRWPPLVDVIKSAVQKQISWGRDRGEYGSIYLFVITNDNDAGLDHGGANTFRMMDALGVADNDTMPNLSKEMRTDDLKAQKKQLESQQRADMMKMAETPSFPMPIYNQGGASNDMGQYPASLQKDFEDTQKKLDEVNEKLKNSDAPVESTDIDGLKVLICSLVPPDTPAGQPWDYTYIHAKLMIVDDVFTTIGSANLNTRSMEADSELNICHESSKATRPLREKLWGIHTKVNEGQSPEWGEKNGRLDAELAYADWGNIIKKNKDKKKKGEPPNAPLVGFCYEGTQKSEMD